MTPPDGPRPPQGPPPGPPDPELSGEALEVFWRQATGQFIEQTEAILRMRGEALKNNFQRMGLNYEQALIEFDRNIDTPYNQPTSLSRDLHQQINTYKQLESTAATAEYDTEPIGHIISIDGSAAIHEIEPYVDIGESIISQGRDNGERLRQTDFYVQNNRIFQRSFNVRDGEAGPPFEEELEVSAVEPFLAQLRSRCIAIIEQVYPRKA